MSAVLKALAWVAPGAAMARARALATVGATRRYEGAEGGRRAVAWNARGTSANAALAPALGTLRDRSRDLARNTWFGKRILDVSVAHLVGTGINPVFDTGQDRADRAAGQVWADFVGTADIEGESDLHGLVALAVRSMLEGGESVLRLVPRELGEGGFPLALQLLEGDHIDSGREGAPEGRLSRLGVGLGEWQRRTGYWLLPAHPGEWGSALPGNPRNVSSFVERRDVVHLYQSLRPGQIRGVPIFAPIMMASRDLADLVDAMVVKTRVEACHAGFVTLNQEGTGVGVGRAMDPAGRRVDELAPGMITYLEPGEDVKFASPSGSGQFEPVMLTALMAMAAGAGLTYDQMTGDLRQANYSSMRAGKIEFRRQVEQTQWLTLVPRMLNRIRGRVIETAVMAGRLRARAEGYRSDWVMPANEPIDPKKDLEADILAVRAGRMSPQEFIGAWGRDWRQVVQETNTFWKAVDATPAGLVMDIDPRKVSRGGIAQTAPVEDAQTPDAT